MALVGVPLSRHLQATAYDQPNVLTTSPALSGKHHIGAGGKVIHEPEGVVETAAVEGELQMLAASGVDWRTQFAIGSIPPENRLKRRGQHARSAQVCFIGPS